MITPRCSKRLANILRCVFVAYIYNMEINTIKGEKINMLCATFEWALCVGVRGFVFHCVTENSIVMEWGRMLKRSDTTFNKKLFQYSGESRISPRWGLQPSGEANIRICQIFPKTATANRKNLDPRGRTSLVPHPPLRSSSAV